MVDASLSLCGFPASLSLAEETMAMIPCSGSRKRKSAPLEPPIIVSKPKLERSLFASIFGDEALKMVISASYLSQQRVKQPGSLYFTETMEESKVHTEQEIRQSIISISAELDFIPYPTMESPVFIHRLEPSNPLGEDHGLLRINETSFCYLENASAYRLFYRIIKGAVQIESNNLKSHPSNKIKLDTEVVIPSGVKFKLTNPNCVSCLMYFTYENVHTQLLR